MKLRDFIYDPNGCFDYDENLGDDQFGDVDAEAIQYGLAALITRESWRYLELDWEQVEVQTFEEAMLCTDNKGLVLTLPDGTEFQLTIVRSN